MATLAAIDAALYTALVATMHTGTATDALPFSLVARYAGEVTEDRLREACAQFPCALLRADANAGTRTVDAYEDVEDVGTESWTVLVGVEDPREIADAISATTTGVPGILTLTERVMEVLNGLILDGTWIDRRVRCVAYNTPVLVDRGALYVYSLRFEVRRPLPQVTPTTAQLGTGQTLTQIAGDVNLEGTADAAPNPITQLLVY